MSSRGDIAIIGMSGVFPDAENLDQFYQNLKNNRDSIRRLSNLRINNSCLDKSINYREMSHLDRVDLFDYSYFGISKNEAILMDPQERILLQELIHCINNAAYSVKFMEGQKAAIYVSSLDSTYTEKAQGYLRDRDYIHAEANIAGRLAYCLDFRGPAIKIDTACSSSLIAVIEACKELQFGSSDIAFVCASSIHSKFYDDRTNPPIISSSGRCKTFDKDADGIGTGEGVAVLMLKKLNDAIEDNDNIHAVIKGFSSNQDGRQAIGLTAPSPEAQAELLKDAWQRSGIKPEDISFIEAHGTGTKLGDPVEIAGISKAFSAFTDKKQFCAISSVKTNLGHLDAAAGIASVIKTVLQLKKQELFASLHFNKANEHIDFENSPVYVNTDLRKWESDKKRLAAVSSFGIIGTNAHIVLEEFNLNTIPNENKNEKHILKISARSKKSFMQYNDLLYSEIFNKEAAYQDILYTLNTSRDDSQYRYAIVANDRKALLGQLKSIQLESIYTKKHNRPVYFLFSTNIEISKEEIERFCNQSSIYKESVQYCLKDYSEELLEKHEVRVFVHQFSTYKTILSNGVKIEKALGTGFTNLINHHLFNNKPIEDCLNEIINDSYSKTFNKDKFINFQKNNLAGINPLFLGQCTNGVLEENILVQFKPDLFVVDKNNYLEAVSKLYNSGADISWTKLYSDSDFCKRVETVSYPFNMERCWYQELTNENQDNKLYKYRWMKDRSDLKESILKSTDNFILFRDSNDYSNHLEILLKQNNISFLAINQSEKLVLEDDHISIDFTNESHYQELYNFLKVKSILYNGIIHLSLLSENGKSLNLSNLSDEINNRVYSQILAAKVFNEDLKKNGFKFLTFSNNAHKIKTFKDELSLSKSLHFPLIKGLVADYSSVSFKAIDIISEKEDKAELAELMIREINCETEQNFACYINGERFIQSLYEIRKVEKTTFEFSENASFIITGGLRGAGFEVAKSISADDRTLFILGKTKLPENINTETWLSKNRDSAVYEYVKSFAELEKRNKKIYYFSLDIGNEIDLKTVIENIKVLTAKLEGIFHVAGVKGIGRGLQSYLKPEFNQTLSSKIYGTYLLDEYTKQFEPEFMVLFSSINSIVAQKFSIDYTIANYFQDLYSQYRNSEGRKTICINWPGWKETGIAFRLNGNKELNDQGFLKSIYNKDAMNALADALSLKHSNLIVADMNLESFKINPYFIIDEKNKKTEINDNKTVEKKVSEEKIKIDGKTFEDIMLNVWKSLLGNQDIDIYDNFFEIGGHSLLAAKLADKINKTFKIDFDHVELFSYPSIVELNEYLIAEFPNISEYFNNNKNIESKIGMIS